MKYYEFVAILYDKSNSKLTLHHSATDCISATSSLVCPKGATSVTTKAMSGTDMTMVLVYINSRKQLA